MSFSMNLKSMAAVVLLMSFSQIASAVTLDLEKFRAKGLGELQKTFGADRLIGSGDIYFYDGAGSLNLPPVFDYASLNFVMKVQPGTLPSETFAVAYRLGLNGEPASTLAVNQPEGADHFDFTLLGSGIVTLAPTASSENMVELEKLIHEIDPQAQIQSLSAIGLLTYEVQPQFSVTVYGRLQKLTYVKHIDFNHYEYVVPFEFDQPVKIVATSGTVDPDGYRTVTKRLKENGLKFATQTTIPDDLK